MTTTMTVWKVEKGPDGRYRYVMTFKFRSDNFEYFDSYLEARDEADRLNQVLEILET